MDLFNNPGVTKNSERLDMVVVENSNLSTLDLVVQDKILKCENLGTLFLSKVSSDLTSTLLKYRKYGSFRNISRRETLNSIKALNVVLTNLDLEKGDRVAFLSENRQQLITSILSVVVSGFVAVPIHPDFTHEQVARILENSGAKCIFISDDRQFDKLEKIEHFKNIPIITFDNISDDLIYYKDLIKKYKDQYCDLGAVISNISPDDNAYILYSCGGKGNLLGTELTHKNILSSMENLYKEVKIPSDNIVSLSYLPLSSWLGGIFELFSILYQGGEYSFADSNEISTLIENIRETDANVFFATPDIWKKLYEKFNIGVFEEDHELFRLSIGNNLKTGFCVGASLDDAIVQFFKKLDVMIYQCYGYTETSGVIAVRLPDANYSNQNIWKILENIKLKINTDGEILINGDSVSKRYINSHIEKQVFNEDGWFKTGEDGLINESGYLRIILKKQDIITLSNGYRISPQKIESMVESEFVYQFVVVGEGKEFLSALIVPNIEYLEAYTQKELRIEDISTENLLKNKWVRALYKLILETVNDDLPAYETIKGYTLLSERFTVDSMELTPTGKPIRDIIQIKRKQEIENIYKRHENKHFI